MLPLIALRNLARNRRRTLLAMLVVAAGSAGLLVTAGFVRYSFDGLREAIIHGGLGHIEVIPTADLAESVLPSERAGRPPGMQDWAEVRATIEAQPGVRAAGAHHPVRRRGEPRGSHGVVRGRGQRARLDAALMDVETRLRAGAALPDGPPPQGADAALVGLGLARALGVGPGDTMTIMVSTVDGSLNAVDVTVAGLFSTGIQELDARMLQVHLLSAQRALGTPDVTSLAGRGDRRRPGRERRGRPADRARAAAARRSRCWAGKCARRSISRCAGSTSGSSCSSAPSWRLLVVLSAANTLLMSMLERTREFGTLLAIGTSRRQLAALDDARGELAGAHRRRAGCVIAVAVSAALDLLDIKMPPPPGAVDPVDLALLMRAERLRVGHGGHGGRAVLSRRRPPSFASSGCASWTRWVMSERASTASPPPGRPRAEAARAAGRRLQWRAVGPTALHEQRLRDSDIGARAPDAFVARLVLTNRRDGKPHEIEVWRTGTDRLLVRFLDASERGRYLLRRDAGHVAADARC